MEVFLRDILKYDGYKPRFIIIGPDAIDGDNYIVRSVKVMYRAPFITEYGIVYCSKYIDIDTIADIVIDKKDFQRRWGNEDLLLYIPDGSAISLHNPDIKVVDIKTINGWCNRPDCYD